MSQERPTYLWAAELVFRKHRRPLRAREIVTYAQEQGLFSDQMYSRTPQKSLQRALSLHILRAGDRSLFVRTAPGIFYLRELLADGDWASENTGELGVVQYLKPLLYTAPRRTPPPARERVLVIPKQHYKRLLRFQGLRRDNGDLVQQLIKGPVRYIPRTVAEESEEYKQVITYVVVTHGAKVLSFRRGTFNRAAAFLRGSLCIGFGGHVAESDLTIFSHTDSGIVANAVRELQEEVAISDMRSAPHSDDLKIVGIINDDSTEVGRRHVGIVMRYEVADWAAWKEVERGEVSINQLRWIDALGETVDLIEFEYWSQLCWRTLFPVMVKAQPAYRVLRKKSFRGPHILVIVGGIGSGKSSATRYLTQNFDYIEVNSGRSIAELLNLPPVPETPRLAFQEAAWRFIEAPDGPARLATALLAAADRLGSPRIIIDGVRQRSTLQEIRAMARVPVAVLFVHAAPDLALELYDKRERQQKEKVTPDAFMRMLNASVERDIPFLMSEADAVIYNWSGEISYGRTLSAMAEELGLRKTQRAK